MQVFIYCKITLHISGVHRTHHQEYIKLQLQPLVQVIHLRRRSHFSYDIQLRSSWSEVSRKESVLRVKRVWVNCWIVVGYHKRNDFSYASVWPVPEAAVTVLCTPDDGCDGHPKHTEWFYSKWIPAYCCILLDFINLDLRCTEPRI
jgi:hypothetical protein